MSFSKVRANVKNMREFAEETMIIEFSLNVFTEFND